MVKLASRSGAGLSEKNKERVHGYPIKNRLLRSDIFQSEIVWNILVFFGFFHKSAWALYTNAFHGLSIFLWVLMESSERCQRKALYMNIYLPIPQKPPEGSFLLVVSISAPPDCAAVAAAHFLYHSLEMRVCLIFFWSWNIPYMSASDVGGHPGT